MIMPNPNNKKYLSMNEIPKPGEDFLTIDLHFYGGHNGGKKLAKESELIHGCDITITPISDDELWAKVLGLPGLPNMEGTAE